MISKSSVFTLFLLIIINSFCRSQNYFEGKINYKYEFESGKYDVNVIKNYFPKGSTLIFKQGNYYHKYEGGPMEFDLYNRQENKYYFKNRGSDTIYWKDCSDAGDKIKDFEYSPKNDRVIGILCDKLIIKYKDRSVVHYYNSDSLRTNAAWFKNFKQDGEYMIDEREKSIYLKSVEEMDEIKIIETATKIIRQPVNEAIFKIPTNSILVKQKE